MNFVVLKGNVGKDPKITTFDNGGKVAQFTLATTERGYKTKDGRDVEAKTTWHNIVVKASGLAGICEKYIKKGTPVLLTGKIQERKYQNSDGETRIIMDIVADNMELLGGGAKEEKKDDGYTPIGSGDDLPF